ncbi:uncharacterized protein BDV17DRAFT_293139 [Aspergillus undulatus]|uniref:uncharacterized protein n=1 Tax=Aspergillus undulatus TaxID=1810928 RepID=UPI003CCD15BC
MAGEKNIKFLCTSTSFSGIQNSGNSVSNGFTLFDNDNNILFESSYPIGYAPCMRDTNHLKITSDCWLGTYTFSCTSAFSGSPEACNVYDPDGDETKGEADSDLSFIGISAGIDGTCSGTITTQSEGECTMDSLLKSATLGSMVLSEGLCVIDDGLSCGDI